MKRTILAAVLLAGTALTTPASADTALTLTGPIQTDTLGPQSTSNPCIIAGTACKNPDNFSYNLFSPNNSPSYDRWSTAEFDQNGKPGIDVPESTQGLGYNALALAIAAGGISFGVAIDVNTADRTERLLNFEVWDDTTNTRLYHYTGPTLIGNIANNGNGFGDFLLSTINLVNAGVTATDLISFHASWDNATDGTESFFLVNGTGGTQFSLVPAPLAGAGLPGLVLACGGLIAFARRRRQRMV